MFAIMAAGLFLLVAVAVVVWIVDARRAPIWRDIAAERRERWEAWRAELDGGAS